MKYIAMIKTGYGFNARVCSTREEAEALIQFWRENVVKNPGNSARILLAEVKEEWNLEF